MTVEFADKEAALAHAQQLAEQLQMAGYVVQIVVDESPAKPAPAVSPPPVESVDAPAEGDAVTPLGPDFFEAAKMAGALGKPILIGGEDLEDMAATVVAYQDPDTGEFRNVVFTKVRPVAEEKIMAALAAAQGQQYMTVVKEEAVHGRADFDLQHNVAENIVKYAKSVNYHRGNGNPPPPHTQQGITELRALLDQLAGDQTLTEGEREILDGYRKDLSEIEHAWHSGAKTPRKDYGPRQGQVVRRIKETVPVPQPDGSGPGFVVEERDGSRIKPEEKGGIAYWNGKDRSPSPGKEIVITFDDGWKAIYHPHAKSYKVPWSFAGTLELHAPADADPGDIPRHLERLYLQGRPMGREEAELIYLERNAWAQGLTGTPEYRAIQDKAAARVAEIGAEILFQLSPEDLADLEQVAARAHLEAQRRAMREKIHDMQRLFEQKMGLAEGALKTLPRYKPTPVWEPVHNPSAGIVADTQSPGGHFVWTRFDVDPAAVKAAFKNRVIGHDLTGDRLENLRRIIQGTGILAAQEKRLQMGAMPKGGTMSPESDQSSGGAAYVFLRVGSAGKYDIEWDPAVLLERSDWFFRNSDQFGATNPDDVHWKSTMKTDIQSAAAATSSSNEITFKNGIGLFGRYAPKRIRVGAANREKVIGWFKEIGVTHLGGRPVEEVVV